MDGLRRFPSFIKCGHWTQPDDKLILQKKRGGRPTTSLDFQSHKSPRSAAALKATSSSKLHHNRKWNSLKWPAIHAVITSELCGNAKIPSLRLVILQVTVNTRAISMHPWSASIIYKWNALQLKFLPVWYI